MSENMELMGNIARAIIQCGELDGVDWVEFTSIFGVNARGEVDNSYGYAYDDKGNPIAAAFLYDDVEREVKAYREWLRLEDDKGFIKMLFQFNRETRKVNAEFEFENTSRWQVTPKNIDTITEQLRPKLGN